MSNSPLTLSKRRPPRVQLSGLSGGNVSVNSKPDHSPPGDPRGFAHSGCPWGRVFAPLSCPGVCPRGVLNQSKSSIILKKSALFALSVKQMGSSFHIFIYAHVPHFGGLSGSEDRGGGDNSIQFTNFGRVGDKSFKE